MIEFNQEKHEYRVGGVIKPSVSEILKSVSGYDNIPGQILQSAAHFGSAVHRACELDDLGELDLGTLDPMIEPYLMAWRAFCDQHVAYFLEIEEPIYNHVLGYCGTPDRVAVLKDETRATIDIKTTSVFMPSTALQLAAYNMPDNIKYRRMAVRLHGQGYQTKEYDDHSDYSVFTSLVVARNWCQRTKSTLNLDKYGANDGN